MSAATDIVAAAQLACLLEASAPKPGNVGPGRHFEDARYEDFLASAAAIGPAFAGVAARPLGATIRCAVEATARWTRSNTNLGIVLLLAPIAKAAAITAADDGTNTAAHAAGNDVGAGFQAGPRGFSRGDAGDQALRRAVRDALNATTVADAHEVYAAIRRARPGGLGHVDAQDVAEEPTMTLLDVMRLAADRDGIAREYATAFETTFDTGAPALERARRDGLAWDDAVVETYLTLLAANTDTHVARRAGAARAETITAGARAVLEAGGVRTAAGRDAVAAFDLSLRDAGSSSNPGTTADLTAAAIFVVLLRGGWDTSHGERHATAR